MRFTLPILLLTLAGVGPAQVPAPQKIEVSKLGPQPGERVPEFSLDDQSGVKRNLQSIMGPRGALLVFVRSTDW